MIVRCPDRSALTPKVHCAFACGPGTYVNAPLDARRRFSLNIITELIRVTSASQPLIPQIPISRCVNLELHTSLGSGSEANALLLEEIRIMKVIIILFILNLSFALLRVLRFWFQSTNINNSS